ncbi:carboxylate-amine ligase [Embleya scabrispora]|uniref:carboxylate-amine ligase n=1 Tax=Embleya scabrispora TaxID=159449 RepID=UPI0003759685|nr:glutamate--cysteine ligase [Embleya scabrispora]MYS83945.1 YbdK family carboxylate-amine ligase [Streptomyces sp. SID5474]
MITFGVEEEYLLLDPADGRPIPVAEAVRAAADLQPAVSGGEIQSELLQVQVEVATPVCATLDEVGGHLLRLRHSVAAAAEQVGCRLVASGSAPFGSHAPLVLTDQVRYHALYSDAPRLVEEMFINGMHVHVAVPDRDAGVIVVNRLRPWLPLLVAMAANSPMWEGGDTGFSSWRTIVYGRWSISGVPPEFVDAADYDRRIEELLAAGILRDRAGVYWQVRLSDRYPTVEIRAMDVQLRAEDAVMLAGLVRALVTTVLRDATAGQLAPRPAPEFVTAAQWYAARHGLTDALIDPHAPRRLKAGELVGRLMDYIAPVLADTGDARQIDALVHRLLREGTGADRQRAAFRHGGRDALLRLLVSESMSAHG